MAVIGHKMCCHNEGDNFVRLGGELKPEYRGSELCFLASLLLASSPLGALRGVTLADSLAATTVGGATSSPKRTTGNASLARSNAGIFGPRRGVPKPESEGYRARL